MNENELSKIIVDKAFQIHKDMGPGLLESVYEIILSKELEKAGLTVECQKLIPIKYNEYEISNGFKADIVVNILLSLN